MNWLRKALTVAADVIKKAALVIEAIKAAIALLDPPKPEDTKKD